MKVLALTEGPNHVCCRYRIEAFAWALAERGMTLQVRPLRRGLLTRIRQLRGVRRADLVILQRKCLPIWQLAVLRRSARRLVYDIDDAVFQRDSYRPKGPRSRQRLLRFWATVQAADAVTVGNDYLKHYTSAYVEPDRVHVIPTSVEPRWYRLARHRRVGPATQLTWIGQSSNLPSLHCAGSHLAAVAQRLPGLRLRLICDRSVQLAGLRVVPRRWSSVTEAAELAEGDIGVAWLPEDSWSQGKCGLKVLQYMAAGLPVVANPVGMNAQMVRHGHTGFLASTPGQWAEAVARLAFDPALRRKMGAAGRRLVERQYSVAGWGPRFAGVVEAAAGGSPRKAPSDWAESRRDGTRCPWEDYAFASE